MPVKPAAGDRRALLGSVVSLLGSAALGGCGFMRAQARPSRQEVPAEPAEQVPAAEPAAPPARPTADERTVIAGIQETLERQAAARAALDRTAYVATIDQRNLVWRRIQGDVFTALEGAGRQPRLKYTVTRVQPKPDTFFKAWIDVSNSGGPTYERAVWVFRPTENGWLHSEPVIEELGSRLTYDSEHFRFSYYAWDQDVIERMAAVAEQAYATVTDKLGAAPSVRTIVSANPTYGSHSGLRTLGTVASYDWSSKNLILLRSIESYGAGNVPIGTPPEQTITWPLTHEYTHLVSDQMMRLVKVQPWMYEGLAEYVSGHMREGEVRAAFRGGRQVPLDKASDMIEWATDPARGYTQADVSLAYGESALAVAYFVERFGQDTFFELGHTFGESRRWEESFQQVTGTTWAQYQRDWEAWVRRRLGA